MRTRLDIIVGLALAALLTVPCLVAAEDGVPVPNLAAPEARFAASDKAPRTFVAVNADRARLVAFEAVLITAGMGSEVAIEPALADADHPAVVALRSGAFRLIVGSRAVELELGDNHVRAVSSELTIARLDDVWIVQVAPAGEGGRVELIPPAPAEPPPPVAEDLPEDGAEETPPPAAAPAPEPVALTAGKRHALKHGELEKADRRQSELLDKTAERLADPPADPASSPLAPRDIEDPRDFAVTSAGADAALYDLEIEDIEVDLGCVEICVD